MKKRLKYNKPSDAKSDKKENVEIVRKHNNTTWSYMFWLILFGFSSVGLTFLSGILFVCTLFGVKMGGQLFNLALYFLQGADKDYDFKLENSKVENLVWLCTIGWVLVAMHYFFYGVFRAFFLKGIAYYWKRAAKAVTYPFGVEIDVN